MSKVSKVSIKYRMLMSVLVGILSFGVVQNAMSDDFSDEIKVADHKIVLGEFEDAQEIYQKIVHSSDSSVVAAYAHYKLGALHKRLNDSAKAKEEYSKGLQSLKKAGEANHQIGKYLERALQVIG